MLVWAGLLLLPGASAADESADAWRDGLVEQAIYQASRDIYGRKRRYDAVFLTNTEQHELKKLTKTAGDGEELIEVWKHHQVERIPTEQYDYHFATTSHLTVDGLHLTRLDAATQEWCGVSFKQYLLRPEGWLEYWSFSYMPGAGRSSGRVQAADRLVAWNSLPLFLRRYDFSTREPQELLLLPDQRTNHPAPHEPFRATVRYAALEDDAHRLEVVREGTVIATFWMADDRDHIMLRYEDVYRQAYELTSVQRIDFWSRPE